MHPQQKAARFILSVFAAVMILYLLTAALASWTLNRPMSQVVGPSTGIFGLCGLWGFGRWFYLPPRNGKPVFDERDQQLTLRAWRVGMATLWLSLVFASMAVWAFLLYGKGIERITIPVGLVPAIPFAGFIIATVTQAIATLHFYGWSSAGQEEADDGSHR